MRGKALQAEHEATAFHRAQGMKRLVDGTFYEQLAWRWGSGMVKRSIKAKMWP